MINIYHKSTLSAEDTLLHAIFGEYTQDEVTHMTTIMHITMQQQQEECTLDNDVETFMHYIPVVLNDEGYYENSVISTLICYQMHRDEADQACYE